MSNTRKKQYKESTKRNEIISLMLSVGYITNKDFCVLAKSTADLSNYQNRIRRWKKEGIIEEIQFTYDKRKYRLYKLKDYENLRPVLLKELNKMLVFNYDQVLERLRYRVETYNTEAKLYRLAKRSYTAVMMQKAGVKVRPDEYEKLNIAAGLSKIKEDSVFIFSDELKQMLNQSRIYEEDKDAVAINSRAVGMLFTKEATYTVYTQESNRIIFYNDIERAMASLEFEANEKLREEEIETDHYKRSAVLISENKGIEKLFREDSHQVANKSIMQLPNGVYETIYYVPAGKAGIEALELLRDIKALRKKEREILSQYQPKKKTWLIHDATGKDGEYIYNFMDSDLNRLKKFFEQLESLKDQEVKTRIICFKYQKELLEMIFTKTKIKEVDL